MRTRAWIVSLAVTALLGGAAGAMVAPAGAATSGPVITGCVTNGGTGVQLRHVWNVHQNFPGQTCPSGSFEIGWQGIDVSTPTPSPSPTSTSPAPSPSPTSSSPAPASQCPSTAPVAELTKLARQQTAVVGPSAGSNDNGAVVRQEVWNPDATALFKQDTKVWSSSQWCSTINAAAGNTAVNSYPDVSNTVTDTSNQPIPIDNYATLSSTYAEQMHANAKTDAESAYDIWLARPGGGYDYELMIWVDNHGQRPICHAADASDNCIADAQPTFGGVTYNEYLEQTAKPNTTCGGGECTISLVTQAPSGTTDILAIVKGLVAQGYYPADIGINQVDFGFETPSTGGVDEVFEVDNYSLTAVAAAGKNI